VLEAEFRAQQDQIRIEVLDACSAIRRAGEALEQAAGAAEVAARVAEGERQRFAQGLGSLLIVNLREAAAAQAAQSVVDAKAESALAAAQFRAAMATDLP